MLLRIGQSSFRGAFPRYSRHFSMHEVTAEPGRLPRAPKLKRWREAVPESFSFAVRFAPSASELTSPDNVRDALKYALQVATALEAEWFVLSSPVSVRPTARNRARVVELFESVPSSLKKAWDVGGMWDQEAVASVLDASGAVWSRDLSRADDPQSGAVYTRLKDWGNAVRLRSGPAQQLAINILGADEAMVVVDSLYGLPAKRMLLEELSFGGDDLSDDDMGPPDDYEDEDEEADDDAEESDDEPSSPADDE